MLLGFVDVDVLLITGLMTMLLGGLLSWPAPLWFITSVPARGMLLSLIGVIANQKDLKPSKVIVIILISFLSILIMDHFFPPQKSVQAMFHNTLKNKTWVIVKKEENEKDSDNIRDFRPISRGTQTNSAECC